MKIRIIRFDKRTFEASVIVQGVIHSGLGGSKKRAMLNLCKAFKPVHDAAKKEALLMDAAQTALGNKLFELQNPTVTFREVK